MNYGGITPCSVADGTGFRVVLWCSGCSHNCEGCHNAYLADKEYGKEFLEEALYKLEEYLSKPYIKGLTLSGGDPLFKENRQYMLNLLYSIKMAFPDKDIWCYTGYTFEEVKDLEHMKYIDVLIDGKFDKNLHRRDLAFRGSTNQRIIDVQKSLQNNDVVLYME